MGWGEPNPYVSNLASRLQSCKSFNPEYPDSDKWDMSPLWGFGYLVYATCYKHAAPLGLNAPTAPKSGALLSS